MTVLKEVNNATKKYQKGAFNWIMITFFGKHYLKYLTKSLVIEGVAKEEAKKQIAEFSSNPSPVMAFIEKENEIEYQNMFGVLQKSLPKIKSGIPKEEEVDRDKMKRLKDLTKEFSSHEMQDIIAGILAGEYNNPGKYLLKTMEIVKNLTKNDLELFAKFGGIIINGSFLFSNFYNINNKNNSFLLSKGIGYNEYLYLKELGLISSVSTSASKYGDSNGKEYFFGFHIANKKIILKLDKKIELNYTLLTRAGQDIFSLIKPIYDEELVHICKKELINQGFKEL